MKKVTSAYDCFRILKIPPSVYEIECRDAFEASSQLQDVILPAVQKAFRRLSMKYHPDHGGKAKDFIQVKEACDTLLGCVRIQRPKRGRGLAIEILPKLRVVRSSHSNSVWEYILLESPFFYDED